MEKNWKKKLLQNLGAILLSGLWVIVGFYLTKDIKLDQRGGMIFFGEGAAAMMVAWFIPGLVCISYIFQEIKLLIQLLLHGGSKIKLGCILLVVIPIALFVFILVVDLNEDKNLDRLHSPTKTAIAKSYGEKGIGTYKIGTDIAPGLWTIPDNSCHWIIVANDGHEIRSISEAESTRIILRYENDIQIELEGDDREFQNIDCGPIKYNEAFK